jgi:hypothetical protein
MKAAQNPLSTHSGVCGLNGSLSPISVARSESWLPPGLDSCVTAIIIEVFRYLFLAILVAET